MHSVVSAVVGYAERGWRVVPLASNGRSPLIELARIVERVFDTREITHWWQIWPYAAVGIATGQPSRLVVVSVPREPSTPVRRLEWRRGPRRVQFTHSLPGDLPRTAVVSHAARLHYYYYMAPERPIPTCEVGDIWIFGEAGVVVAPPPSIHGDSPRWECPLSLTAVSLAPDWVEELATI
jgi:Bifunctional DNA primase/polymerase, N-terminal